jgi:phospho-N-acetylmuramoyl-pentapeptide-transferase
LPLFTLLVGSIVGLVDDLMQIREGCDPKTAGLSFFNRLVIVVALGLAGGWWFYFKLGMIAVSVPFGGTLVLGWLIIPLFVLVMIALFSSGVIDGLDGLAGGVMAIIFAAYTCIAFFQNQIDLAAFCAVITGATLAFLWFNIPPARFYMSETGILGLTVALTVVAFLTNTVFILPLIALPLLATSLSVIIQLGSKKLRHGKKVFLVAPLHHHFEAIGWPAYKVVMRYWVISVMSAIIGIIIALSNLKF